MPAWGVALLELQSLNHSLQLNTRRLGNVGMCLGSVVSPGSTRTPI